MKKLLVFLSVFLLLAGTALAFRPDEPTTTSGEQTADATILTGSGYFKQIVIMPDGSNDVTVTIYDNTASSGTKVLPTLTFAGDGGAQASPPVWVAVNTGIRVDITTAGTVAYVVLYREQ
jgi:hypothetical protein